MKDNKVLRARSTSDRLLLELSFLFLFNTEDDFIPTAIFTLEFIDLCNYFLVLLCFCIFNSKSISIF